MQKPCGRKNTVSRKGLEEDRKTVSVDAAERMVGRACGEVRLENAGHAKLYLCIVKIARSH